MAESSAASSRVRVGVRIRPLTSQEIAQGGTPVLSTQCSEVRLGQRRFTYDAVFDSTVHQEELYLSVSKPLLETFLDGYNATIMAYGQTGSGKTFTMGSEAHAELDLTESMGLIPRFMNDLFASLEAKRDGNQIIDFSLAASFLEVYGEDVHDLLNKDRPSLPLREDASGGVVCAGLTYRSVKTATQALQVLHEGTLNRTTAATLMNLTSSRSHAVFTVDLTQVQRDEDSNIDVTTMSRFTFVDLAGSERMKKTGAEGERAREGIKINEGLLALGNVINALADDERLAEGKKIHVPYRQSKLTRLLQDALGGNSKTLFLACVSPSDTNASETLSTLHYANRARNIKNAPTKNVDGATMELQKLQAYNHILQLELVKLKFGEGFKENRSPACEEHLATNDEQLLQREDVTEYLRGLRDKAELMHGETRPIDLPIGTTKLLPQTNASTPSPPRDMLAPFSDDGPNNKSILESFDPCMLDEVNPDEEMAILDQLLELQQKENEFDKAQKKEDAQLKEVEGELAKQECMLLQLRESLKVYHTMKAKYEVLMAEVQQLEVEKAQLAEQLEKASVDPTQGCSISIKKELEKVEKSLARARNETRKHRQMCKKAEQEAQKCRVLERRINELKNGRAALMRKQKEAAAKHREYTESKTREILALKKKERNREREFSKLQSEIQMHKKNLEKRQNYCTKLAQKLKQTEDHLMKLLSMRQRDFKRRQSVKVVQKSVNEHLLHTREGERQFAPVSEETNSLLFVIDETVQEKVRISTLNQQYEERVNEYSSTMRSLVEAVKALEAAEKGVGDEKSTLSSVSDLAQNVEEVELKVELLSSELDNLRSQLQREEEKSSQISNDAITNLIADKSAAILRTVLSSIVDKLVEAQLQKKHLEGAFERKKSVAQSLESEVEGLNEKIDVLSKEISARRALEGDPFPTMKELQTEKDALCEKVQILESEISEIKMERDSMQGTVGSLEQSLCITKEQLTTTEVALSQVNGVVVPDEVMKQLQGLWAEVGVAPEAREKARSEIASCLEDTCQRKLNEALETKERIFQQISKLESEIQAMQEAIGEMPMELDERETTLIQKLDAATAQHAALRPAFSSAVSRRSTLTDQARDFVQSLELSSTDLGESIQKLLEEHAEQDPESGELPRVAKGSLSTLFLEECEFELSKLRIEKSKVLARNTEVRKSASTLASEMNLSEGEIIALVSKSIPMWWNKDALEAVVRSISSDSGVIRSTKSFSLHLEYVRDCLDRTSRARRLLSVKLKGIVERAQRTLIDAVNGEIDAREAYSSFHDALFRLPPLSKDFIDACSSEITALSSGVDVMTQSEIEALAVVWEALNESMSTRGKFWGTIDNEILSMKANPSGPFEDVLQESQLCGEDWLLGVVKDITTQYRILETRLHKLEKVHSEVERLRSRQDAKSRIISLDSEVRILNAQLSEFEDKKCGKNRLLTKKSGSSGLLKEERFRKQMQAKFAAKLDQLANLLTGWESDEGRPFDAELLSDEVRMLLSAAGDRHNWVEKRTEFMHLRTVKSTVISKRRIENAESESPPKKRQARSQKDAKQADSLESNENARPNRLESTTRKRKTDGIAHSRHEAKARLLSPGKTGRVTRSRSVFVKEPQLKGFPEENTTTNKRLTLPPFGHVLAQAQSPRDQGNEQEF